MIDFLRSLFGMKGVAGNRTVAGTPVSISARDAAYIRDSHRRLTALQELCKRYSNTRYAPKMEAVYEKTKRIHAFMVARKSAHELELFHLQHTDHFLNTFNVIMDVHQQHHLTRIPVRSISARADAVVRKVVAGTFRKENKGVEEARQLNKQTSQQVFADLSGTRTGVPRLTVPEIAINTYSRLVYLKEESPDTFTTHEIGFTSTPEEKEAFVAYVSHLLGLEGISYAGNALVYIPSLNTQQSAEMVPVIYWNGSPYVVLLEDYSIYPVRTFRKGTKNRSGL